ncbi:hypothetical protein JY651_20045 [Pyxidicoccus parkwayensis]|uniref:Uncharacterized protein n=1 Tax=Pyxidicoccus parkwayensis TaxID=2813578 RepID=A0ABX7P9C4_9BACT|nr:hypothetical protein [Pyxidicoccus parkwaysis]QSQ27063.1 hypothetical protein JY651_20045 [Pyxidicoccus parkwaysis]
MGLKQAIESLGNQIDDLSKLEVVTYTGKVDVAISGTGAIDWDKLKTAAKTNGDVKLVAATQLNFDGDSYSFQTNEELPRINELLALHQQAINSSLQARKAITDFFATSIKKLVE